MYRYKFKDGSSVTSTLDKSEFLRRIKRLDVLRVMTEGYESGEGLSIYRKTMRAYHKVDRFTGIIRLTITEKDWLSYLLESDMLNDEEIECINFYCRY